MLEAFTLWNTLAQRLNLPLAHDLNPRRRRQIERRLNAIQTEPPLNAWRRALAAVEASPFCQGQGPNGWRADLDFVCRANAFARLLEGAYAPAPAPEQPAPDPHAQWRPRIAEWTRNRFWNDLDWGPRPGREGCRVPGALLAAKTPLPFMGEGGEKRPASAGIGSTTICRSSRRTPQPAAEADPKGGGEGAPSPPPAQPRTPPASPVSALSTAARSPSPAGGRGEGLPTPAAFNASDPE